MFGAVSGSKEEKGDTDMGTMMQEGMGKARGEVRGCWCGGGGGGGLTPWGAVALAVVLLATGTVEAAEGRRGRTHGHR